MSNTTPESTITPDDFSTWLAFFAKMRERIASLPEATVLDYRTRAAFSLEVIEGAVQKIPTHPLKLYLGPEHHHVYHCRLTLQGEWLKFELKHQRGEVYLPDAWLRLPLSEVSWTYHFPQGREDVLTMSIETGQAEHVFQAAAFHVAKGIRAPEYAGIYEHEMELPHVVWVLNWIDSLLFGEKQATAAVRTYPYKDWHAFATDKGEYCYGPIGGVVGTGYTRSDLRRLVFDDIELVQQLFSALEGQMPEHLLDREHRDQIWGSPIVDQDLWRNLLQQVQDLQSQDRGAPILQMDNASKALTLFHDQLPSSSGSIAWSRAWLLMYHYYEQCRMKSLRIDAPVALENALFWVLWILRPDLIKVEQ